MNFILKIQNLLLDSSPALYPLLALLYSFLSSPHCAFMCSPLLDFKSKEPYYFGRLISYTLMGAFIAYFGEILKNSLSYQLLSYLAFFFYVLATFIFLLSYFHISIWRGKRVKSPWKGAFLRGLFSAFIPCHLLLFFYSLAALSGNSLGGALILFSHATITTPALAYGRKYLIRIPQQFAWGKQLIFLMIFFLSVVNLMFFASQLFYEADEVRSKFLFCF